MNDIISSPQTADLLDLELSHEPDDDVSKPVQNDGMPLFNYEMPNESEPMLGNNINNNNNNDSSINNNNNNNIGSIGNNKIDNNNNNNKTAGGDDDIDASNVKCWNIQYYQPYFDIDTSQELHRLRKALFPFMSGEFFDKDLNEKPDLYGPFWIITTLAFLMAAMGNFASYINTNEESIGEWNGDITRISEAATFLYTGSAIVPILLYIVLRTYEENTGLIELVSLYGYSLMPFIVACILCIAPWNFMDWAVVLTSMSSSILFLIKNIYKPLSDEKKSKPGFYVLVIITGSLIINTYSECEYIAYDWDLLKDSNDSSDLLKTLRKYEYNDWSNYAVYLPPFPKAIGGNDNDTYSIIPYPTKVCLQSGTNNADFKSYKFICRNGIPFIEKYTEINCEGVGVEQSIEVSPAILEHNCNKDGLDSCQYVSVQEEYYYAEYDENHQNQPRITNQCNQEDEDIIYSISYAVDVCLQNVGGSYKFQCDNRTKTYSLTQYTDTLCNDIIDLPDIIGLTDIADEAGEECFADLQNFNIYIINGTDPNGEPEEIIDGIKSTFITCTSEDEFEIEFEENCISSIVQFNSITKETSDTIFPQFGAYGIRPVSEKQLSRFDNNTCNPCNILNSINCTNQYIIWDNSILFIDESNTKTIINCDGGTKQFVEDIQSISNKSNIHGIVFTSNQNISNTADEMPSDDGITIPVRIMNVVLSNARKSEYFAVDPIKSTEVFSLSCNTGYPKQICITISCVFDELCPNMVFSGTYKIQNKTKWFNSNPIYYKEAYGGINAHYIWLEAIVIDEDIGAGIQPFIQLRWVISAEKGNSNNGLWCNSTLYDIKTVISDDQDQNLLTNFDITGCEWISINDYNNISSLNVKKSAPYQCLENIIQAPIDSICVSTYQNNSNGISNYVGTYYELATNSAFYVHEDDNTDNSIQSVLKRGYLYECTNNLEKNKNPEIGYYYYPTNDINDKCGSYSDAINIDINWILYDPMDDNRIKAYCEAEINTDPQRIGACNEWYIYDAINVDSSNPSPSYKRDGSFDVDKDSCNSTQPDLAEFIEYEDSLCFELNLNNSTQEMLYSQVQYLWGQYTKLDKNNLFNSRPIYQNNRLMNTEYDTYLIWYDPKDSWIFLTKPNFKYINNKQIFNDFEKFADFDNETNDNVIMAFCDNNDNEENHFPEQCDVGWIVNGEYINKTSLELTAFNDDCSGIKSMDELNFTAAQEIDDLCVAFYERDGECVLPEEEYNTFNGKRDECSISTYFEEENWCNTTEESTEGCHTINGNGIYTQFDINKLISNRSYWVHENGDQNDKILFYVYYHKYLRFWVWTNDEGDNNEERIDNFQEIQELEIKAWCLNWDLNAPFISEQESCTEFFYGNTQNASSVVTDCTIIRDQSADLGGEISGYIVVSCFILAVCVFSIGFYREAMERRAKKRAANQTILGSQNSRNNDDNSTELAMRSQIDVNQPMTIKEEKTDDLNKEDDDDKETNLLNPAKVQSASSTDVSDQQ